MPKAEQQVRRHLKLSGWSVLLLLFFAASSLSCSYSLDGGFSGCPDARWSSTTPRKGPTGRQAKGMICSSRYLTMRDGTKIAIDLCLPKGWETGEPLPTIIRQTRYGRSYALQPPFSLFWSKRPYAPKLTRQVPAFFVKHGYAWVEVDVRGTGASFGTRAHPFSPEEIRDGAEIVDWIVKQPWSNGRVGSMGASYSGVAAGFLIVNNHPAVKAVAPRFSAFDLYAEQGYPGGIQLVWFTNTWGRLNEAMDRNAPHEFFGWEVKLYVKGIRPVDRDRNGRMLREAVKEHAGNLDIRRNAWRVTFRDDPLPHHSDRNMDTFSPHAYVKEMKNSKAAVYNYSGWFDGACALSAIRRYLSVDNPGSRLTLGPWAHGGWRNHSPWADNRKSCFDHDGEMLDFFDRHLKQREGAPRESSPVRYYTMGEERWKEANTWPPPGWERFPLYFSPDYRLSPDSPQTLETHDTYRVDDTAGTGSGSRWKILMGTKPYDIYPDRRKEDEKLLCYTSEPLQSPLEVTGHPVVTLFLCSTAGDGNVFAYLEDVDPKGRVRYVTEGELRVIHRRTSTPPHGLPIPYRTFRRKDATRLARGEVHELSFDLLPTSYLFKQGHCLRVALAGADQDHFAARQGAPPELRFFRSRTCPSHIDLPVIPGEPAAAASDG